MDQSLEREIRRLYSCFHSAGDPHGRSFVPLADAYRRAGDPQRARLLLEEGLRRHPSFASAHVVAMRIARDVSDHAGALSATRRVLELDPGNVEARRALTDMGPLVDDVRSPAASISRNEGDAGLPDVSWMVGDAGVWGAGTDSGLASVDPDALEAEEKQAVARETVEREVAEDGGEQAGARQAEERETAGEAAEREADGAEEEAMPAVGRKRATTPAAHGETAASPRSTPAETPSDGDDSEADAGIYTRTMGRVYEQQGLDAQAIAVYERLLEAEPGDDALAMHLDRLRRKAGDDASGGPDPAPPDADRSTTAEATAVEASARAKPSGGSPFRKRPGAAPNPGDRVIPIEELAPDAPVVGAHGEAP